MYIPGTDANVCLQLCESTTSFFLGETRLEHAKISDISKLAPITRAFTCLLYRAAAAPMALREIENTAVRAGKIHRDKRFWKCLYSPFPGVYPQASSLRRDASADFSTEIYAMHFKYGALT